MITFLAIGLPLLMAVILHELAHGYVAKWNGDPTAERAGRLTLNPLAHVDPVGTVLLPGLLYATGAPIFGWAKPVPVHFGNLRDPRRDMVKVAAAGPATNLILALAFAALFHAVGGFEARGSLTALLALAAVKVNVLLAVLNLMPILPLDGGRILVGLLPRPQALALARLEPYGMMIVFGLLATGMLGKILWPIENLVLRTLL